MEADVRDRQRYNFLAGFIRQVQGALDDDDGLATDLSDVLLDLAIIAELHERIGDLEQWVAQLDPGVGDDEQENSDSPEEGAVGHPESAQDDDVGPMGPPVVNRSPRPDVSPRPACKPATRPSAKRAGQGRRAAVSSSNGKSKPKVVRARTR